VDALFDIQFSIYNGYYMIKQSLRTFSGSQQRQNDTNFLKHAHIMTGNGNHTYLTWRYWTEKRKIVFY